MLSIKHEILEALIQIKKHGGDEDLLGICGNVWQHVYEKNLEVEKLPLVLYNTLDELFASWPHHSGEELYPVGGARIYCRDEEEGNLWKEPMRLDLLHFAIDKLTEELDYADA